MIHYGITINYPDTQKNKIYNNKYIKTKINTLQILLKSRILNKINGLNKICKNFKNIYIHSSYQINIGISPIPRFETLFNNSLDILIEEILLSKQLNSKGIIIHIGKNVGNQFNDDIINNNMIENIIELFNRLNKINIKINLIIETSSGQKGEMFYNLTHRRIWHICPPVPQTWRVQYQVLQVIVSKARVSAAFYHSLNFWHFHIYDKSVSHFYDNVFKYCHQLVAPHNEDMPKMVDNL